MAVSELVTNLVPFISWAFLPQLLTRLTLSGMYGCQLVQRPTVPIQAQLHARRVQALVIVAYLLYTVYASVYQRPANYYELLGVSLDSDGDAVRRSFRRLARIYHPDKTRGRRQDEALFIELRRAHDGLADPLKRTAYDRFGASLLDNKRDLLTERDLFLQGLQSSLSFYVVHPLMHGFINWLGGRKPITYWFLTLYVALLASEFSLIVRGQRWYALGSLPLPATMTAHDLIVSLHSAYTAVILASTHLGNLLPTLRDAHVTVPFNHLFDGAASERDLVALRQLVQQQEARSAEMRIQSGRNMDMSLLPLRPMTRATTQTLQQAANEAAKRRSGKPVNAAAGLASRKPSTMEQIYIDRLSQLLLRHRLEVIPVVRDAERRRSSMERAKGSTMPDSVAVKAPTEAAAATTTTAGTMGTMAEGSQDSSVKVKGLPDDPANDLPPVNESQAQPNGHHFTNGGTISLSSLPT